MDNTDSPQTAVPSGKIGVADFFGLIAVVDTERAELHGYEVTMSGRLVIPELSPRRDAHNAEPPAARAQ